MRFRLTSIILLEETLALDRWSVVGVDCRVLEAGSGHLGHRELDLDGLGPVEAPEFLGTLPLQSRIVSLSQARGVIPWNYEALGSGSRMQFH